MKRLLVGSLLALALLLGSRQQASAYFKSQFGVGLQWNIECGGNKLAWGLYSSQPMPGGGGAWPGMYPSFGMGSGYGYGGYPMADAYTAPSTAPATVTPAPANSSTPAAATVPSAVKPVGSSAATRQVNYSYETAPSYNYGGYNYGGYNYGGYNYGNYGSTGYNYGYGYGYQTPSYWYGN
jgi:hypothetical protein